MNNVLNLQTLAEMDTGVAVLSVGRYALPARFRVRGAAVECQVPTWSGVGDVLEEEPGEVTLVAICKSETDLRWLFLRGKAAVIQDPDWAGLQPRCCDGVGPDDLYHLIRITPTRLELVDEQRGWGFRETVDL